MTDEFQCWMALFVHAPLSYGAHCVIYSLRDSLFLFPARTAAVLSYLFALGELSAADVCGNGWIRF